MNAKCAPEIKAAQIIMGAFLYNSLLHGKGEGIARARQLNIGVLSGQGVLVNKFDGRSERRRMERAARKNRGDE